MDARAGQAQDRVAGLDRPGQQMAALRRADREASQVVVPLRIHSRHFRRLAADQGAAGLVAAAGDAGDDRPGLRHRQVCRWRNSPGRTVVRRRATTRSLTHIATRSTPTVSCSPVSMAIFSLVPTPSVVETSTGSEKPAAFRSNSAPNPPNPPITPGLARRLGERLDRLDQRVARLDIHPGGTVIQAAAERLPPEACLGYPQWSWQPHCHVRGRWSEADRNHGRAIDCNPPDKGGVECLMARRSDREPPRPW